MGEEVGKEREVDEKTLEKRLQEDAQRLRTEFSSQLHERLRRVTIHPRKPVYSWRRRVTAGALACSLLFGLVWLGGDFDLKPGNETLVSTDVSELEKGLWNRIFPWTETVVLLADVSELPLQPWRYSSVALTEESQYWMERLAPFSVWTVASWSLEEDLDKKEHCE